MGSKKSNKIKTSQIAILLLVILALGVYLTKTNFYKSLITPPTKELVNNSVAMPSEAKYLLIATEPTTTNEVSIYKIDKNSGNTVSQSSFSLTKDTGHIGCSSFKGSYSSCKNAVWFSKSGNKAVVQTEYQQAMFEEPPFWYAWYLLDTNSGKLMQLYKADIRMIEWLYDDIKDKVFFVVQIENNNNEPRPRRYFQIDVTTKTVLEIKENQYPKNIFVNYYQLFSLTSSNKLKYKKNDGVIETSIPLGHISEVSGVGWSN